MSSIRAALIFLLLGALPAGAADRYAATTQSLRTHHAPQWYEDAKFGIFIHWGPYSVPAYHEWYVDFISPKANYGFLFGTPPYTAERGELPEELFLEKTRSEAVEYHRKNWGADFPYDGFLPMFRAEKFDPAAWARLFRDAGAQYVVLTAKRRCPCWPETVAGHSDHGSSKAGRATREARHVRCDIDGPSVHRDRHGGIGVRRRRARVVRCVECERHGTRAVHRGRGQRQLRVGA